MKMIMAIVPKKYGEDVLSALINAGFTATYSETRGGMLRQSQYTLYIAVRSSDVQAALNVITDSCNEIETIHKGMGCGATVSRIWQTKARRWAKARQWSLSGRSTSSRWAKRNV